MAGTWSGLTNQPTFNASTMLLLTDGTVLCQNSDSSDWYRLTPDESGSYVNGSWSSKLAAGPNSPLYYASAVLKDGRVFVAGGEYNAGVAADLLAAEIYDPVNDAWTTLATPAGWASIGDAPSCVLPDGRVLVGSIGDTKTAIYDPVANTWTAAANKGDASSEETWTLLPDETVLVVQCTNHAGSPNTEKYVIAEDKWVSAGSTPSDLVEASSIEIGPAVLLPDGRVFAMGATVHTALYAFPPIASQEGSWVAGPDMPQVSGQNLGAKDAPCCLLPNGRVLCAVGPVDGVSGNYLSPTYFYEFDPGSSTFTAITNPANSGGPPYVGRMLLLPTGQVLFANGSTTVQVYTPDGTPDPTWKPTITSCPTALQPNQTCKLSGRQLNGLSQAVSYGDDAQMATNYPIVRICNLATGHVFYCRTHGHSEMVVNTGTVVHSTQLDVPAGIERGAAILQVIANGISSDPFAVTIGKVKEHKDKDKDFKEKEKDFKEKEKDFFKEKDRDFKDAETKIVYEGPVASMPGVEPEWLQRIIHQLSDRLDRVEAQLATQRAFIAPHERPRVGDESLRKSEQAQGKKPDADRTRKPPRSKG